MLTKKEIREYSRRLKEEYKVYAGEICPITFNDLDIIVQVVCRVLPRVALFKTQAYTKYCKAYACMFANSRVLNELERMTIATNRGILVGITVVEKKYNRTKTGWNLYSAKTCLIDINKALSLNKNFKLRAKSIKYQGVVVKQITGDKIKSQYVDNKLTLPYILSSISTGQSVEKVVLTFNYETARIFY